MSGETMKQKHRPLTVINDKHFWKTNILGYGRKNIEQSQCSRWLLIKWKLHIDILGDILG